MDHATYAKIVAELKNLGYDTSKLKKQQPKQTR